LISNNKLLYYYKFEIIKTAFPPKCLSASMIQPLLKTDVQKLAYKINE